MKRFFVAATLAAAAAVPSTQAFGDELALGYFMGPRHPMNAGVFTPFGEAVAEASNGALTVQQFPGGALSSSPPGQYSALLSGIMDIAFALPGYTTDLFPVTTVISAPGLCDSAQACTEALLRAKPMIEEEYDAKLLAVWANEPPILLTRDTPVRSVADLEGMSVRVTTSADVPYLQAMGAAPVSQPASVLNQNLANGVIDAIVIDPSAIRSFSLHEPANYVTTGLPLSGAAFVLLMNNDVYNGLSEEERGWIDAASGEALSRAGGEAYAAAGASGLAFALENGVELIELSAEAQAEMNAAIAEPFEAFRAAELSGGMTGGEIYDLMAGE